MAATLLGHVDWSMERDSMGHRDYNITWLVSTDDPLDDPSIVMTCPGLPTIGSAWNFGNGVDAWALCWPNFKFTPLVTHEPNTWWFVEQKFSTHPIQRCQNTSIENPLMEPYKVGGGFTKRTRLIDSDKDGIPIRSSSQQRFTGGELEFDDNRPSVTVSFNTLLWPGNLFAEMMDTVNDAPLWGLPTRAIKLSNATFQRNLWGVCNFYFTVNYEFELVVKTDPDTNQFTGWDRYISDRGNRVLRGYSPGSWEIVRGDANGNPIQPTTNNNATNPLTGVAWAVGDLVQPGTQMNPDAPDPTNNDKPNYLNPNNYEAFRMAADGEITEAFLDGKGRPVRNADSANKVFVQHYPESNFLLLGVPTDLNANLFP